MKAVLNFNILKHYACHDVPPLLRTISYVTGQSPYEIAKKLQSENIIVSDCHYYQDVHAFQVAAEKLKDFPGFKMYAIDSHDRSEYADALAEIIATAQLRGDHAVADQLTPIYQQYHLESRQ